MTAVEIIAGIAWDPQIRGILATLVGVVVLMGSVYLLLLTNVGARLGFLVACSALFGWCTLMGLTWWAYGTIGMLGTAPSWQVKEIVYDPTGETAGLADADLGYAHDLDTSNLIPIDELNDLDADAIAQLESDLADDLAGWQLLPESNRAFGEAKAAVDEWFVEHGFASLDIPADSSAPSFYIASYSFERGGKEDLPDDPSRIDRIQNRLYTTFVQLQHPPRYALIQIQRVVDQEAEPGEAPPTPEADDSQPVLSVILERDLGDVRFPGAMLTIFSGTMFCVTLVMLQRRDLAAAEARGIDTGRGKKA